MRDLNRTKKNSKFSVRAISDLVVVREPERFVRLHIKLNGVSETLVCSHDFSGFISDLKHSSILAPLSSRDFPGCGRACIQMERLGLVNLTARKQWLPTYLLNKNADALIDAFDARWSAIADMVDDE